MPCGLGQLYAAYRFVEGGVVRWVSASYSGGADNAWHHYVLMRKGTNLRIYRDGSVSVSGTDSRNAGSLAPATRLMYIGSNMVGTQNSPGFCDDFRVFSRALTAAEIVALYNSGAGLAGPVGATATQTHDPNGNLTNDGAALQLTWDAMNRLREARDAVSSALIASYLYDADNRRVRKSVTGAALLLWRGREGRLLGGVAVVTVVFTGLIVYAWIYKNLQDCGCFGKYLKMTPGWSVFKNVVVLGLIALAWRGEGARKAGAALRSVGFVRSALIAAISFVMMAGAGISAVLDDAGSGRIKRQATPPGQAVAASTTPAVSTPEAAATSPTLRAAALSPKPTATTGPRTAAPLPKPSTAGPQIGADKFSGYVFEWKGKRYDLTRGLYIVVMISDSCEGCAEIVRSLNTLTGNKDLPPIVAFVLGEKETLERFRENYSPGFPTNLMAPLDFLDRIGEAPPRFILVKDGKQLQYWDTKKAPDEMTLLEAVLTAS